MPNTLAHRARTLLFSSALVVLCPALAAAQTTPAPTPAPAAPTRSTARGGNAGALVRIQLHPRGRTTAVTYVDIAVRGTEAPIHLVRRIDGTCTRVADATDVLARVACETPSARIAFEVARDGTEIVVRRGTYALATDAATTPTDATTQSTADGATQDAAPAVIARAVLPPRTTVRVE